MARQGNSRRVEQWLRSTDEAGGEVSRNSRRSGSHSRHDRHLYPGTFNNQTNLANVPEADEDATPNWRELSPISRARLGYPLTDQSVNAHPDFENWRSTTRNSPAPSPRTLARAFPPNSRLAIFIDEIAGGALLGNVLDGGSQGFVCMARTVERERWMVRKIADLENEYVREYHGMPSEAWLNNWLANWRGKVEMVTSAKLDSGNLWCLWFKFCNGQSLQKFHQVHVDSDVLYSPVFFWHLARWAILTLGYMLYGFERPNGHEGSSAESPDRFMPEAWHSMTHQDFHMGNVLLRFADNTSLPRFYLSDLGDASFAAETRGNSQSRPFDDTLELLMVGYLLRTVANRVDRNRHGASEIRNLFYADGDRQPLWPAEVDFLSPNTPHPAPPNVRTRHELMRILDPGRVPPPSIREIKRRCPMTWYLLAEILPLCDRMLHRLRRSQANGMSWSRLGVISSPRIYALNPGDQAPHWINDVHGNWRWVIIDNQDRVIGNVRREDAPRTSEGRNTWNSSR